MLKNIFLILSICIVFFGCKSNKKNNVATADVDINSIFHTYFDKYSNIKNIHPDIQYTDLKRLLISVSDNDDEYIFVYKPISHHENSLEISCGEKNVDILPFGNLENLEYLSIRSKRNINASLFANLKNLKELTLGGNYRYSTIFDLSSILNLENLESLRIEQYVDVINISLISELINLKSLYINDNNIIDISPIASLKNLEFLGIIGDGIIEGNIINISPIDNLENLESLYFYSGRFSDISSIGKLENLKSLELLQCFNIFDISSIGRLHNLETLRLEGWNQIEDYNPIFNLTSLKRLFIHGDFSLTYIERLQNLEFLEINSRITQNDLNKITKLKQLKELTIHSPDFYDVRPLLGLPNLGKLELGTNYSKTFINIAPLVASNSLEYIQTDFISWERLEDFRNNEGKLFEGRGIYVIPSDMR
jgi:internalin A